MQKRLQLVNISVNYIFSTEEINPITRKSISKVVMQPSFRAVGQKAVDGRYFKKPENKQQM